MTDKIADQPEGATPLDDISGLLREDITTRRQLDEAESLNIVNAVEWIERGRLGDVFTMEFRLCRAMFIRLANCVLPIPSACLMDAIQPLWGRDGTLAAANTSSSCRVFCRATRDCCLRAMCSS